MLRIELTVYANGLTEKIERQNAVRLLEFALEHVKAGDSLPDAIGGPEGNVYCKMRREP